MGVTVGCFGGRRTRTFSYADERLSHRLRKYRMAGNRRAISRIKSEEFDPGSERTLAAWLRHASRTVRCGLL